MLLFFLNGRSVVRMSKKKKKKINVLKPRGKSFVILAFLGICGKVFWGVVWQLAITNGFLPALITQPTNSVYDSINWGRLSNLTAGWREGKEATFFSPGKEVRIMHASLPAYKPS